MSKYIWLGEALFWKYLIIDICFYLNISIFFSHFDYSKKCDAGFGCAYAIAVFYWAYIWAENKYLNYCQNFTLGIWDFFFNWHCSL